MKINYHNVEQIDDNIFVLHNFISQEESNQYLSIIDLVNEEDWWKENGGWYKGKYLYVGDHKEIQDTSKEIVTRFKNTFENGHTYLYGNPVSIHRMLPGEEMFLHADFPELDNASEEVVLFNTAIYHNDVLGGEIFYPEIGIEYHPRQGDVVLHPGTTKYKHSVKPVKDKPRYISTLWAANSLGMSIKSSGNIYKQQD
jgi:hypothetical protein